ncbi:MAG: hypothetical protein ACTHK0_20135 [Ginsengibacter sp.]
MQPHQANSFLKRIRNKYRLIILNENTFEEIVAFKLNRWTVYVALSMMFIVLVGLTIALIAFTPLKFYIPGYGKSGSNNEYESLKVKADSIEKTLILKQQYFDNIERILKGNEVPSDTAVLKVKKQDASGRKKK